ncbi:oligopeptide/dipeptide ABC transporter ATP-binding protein [Streptomyces cellulosae]|uniref:ATP-binding cassette domain-containing protein n=2 Tax=Streptomyces TaxID=1883 RepID=A0ABU3JD57_9ACTN|nr:ATP-binding cassette domain-containing protein [Streptomyces sp. McG7]MDQ0490978.1 peptide/nickel transport system ATP-binding protein [Streptomyces thermodiastaticus]MDT6972987.1 ATP-binding cassette domain-containing protein [Streptomyces thermocarboxydus]WSB43670.1 ATP-binding cassette domain-containing protein [Streptomyces cellulosae]UVT11915.1 ATP-binding cassette domain-containing protein [Streptomyces thermocarboxydus]
MSLLELDGVKVHFPIKKGLLFDRTVGHVYAVDGVSLKVEAGETYGLVGESGCGKTTLGRSVLRLVDITEGSVVLDGTDLAKLPGEEMRRFRRRLQMVFQDPLGSLNPRQNIESILSEGMIAHGIGKDQEERREKIKAILDKVGLPSNALARYPHEFSGGQRQRIGIARALVLEPDVIICDEPVSALDVSVQAQVINLLEELQEELGLTYVVIAHDLAVVRHISDTIGVMYLGSLVEEAPSDALYAEPKHPYTKALMSAVPVPDPEVEDKRERILLTGDLPSPANPPTGCRFHTRCPWAQAERCATERPQLRDVGGGHRVACHYAEDIASGKLRLTKGEVVSATREGVDDNPESNTEAEDAPAKVPAQAEKVSKDEKPAEAEKADEKPAKTEKKPEKAEAAKADEAEEPEKAV